MKLLHLVLIGSIILLNSAPCWGQLNPQPINPDENLEKNPEILSISEEILSYDLSPASTRSRRTSIDLGITLWYAYQANGAFILENVLKIEFPVNKKRTPLEILNEQAMHIPRLEAAAARNEGESRAMLSDWKISQLAALNALLATHGKEMAWVDVTSKAALESQRIEMAALRLESSIIDEERKRD